MPIPTIVTSADGKGVMIIASWSAGSDAGPSLFHSLDGGATWQATSLPDAGNVRSCAPPGIPKGCSVDSAITQVTFLNPRDGWALAGSSVYRTADSGATWSRSQIDLSTLSSLISATGFGYPSDIDSSLPGQLQFQSLSTGWLVPTYRGGPHDPPFLFRTRDGGSTWQIRTLPIVGESQSGLYGLHFFDSATGIVRIDKSVFSTTDGGNSWRGPIPLRSGVIDFVDVNHWVGLPAAGGWMSSSDGGLNWVITPPAANQQAGSAPVPAHGLPKMLCFEFCGGGLSFASPTHGWAMIPLTGGTALFETTDGGVNWTAVALPELDIPGNA